MALLSESSVQHLPKRDTLPSTFSKGGAPVSSTFLKEGATVSHSFLKVGATLVS